MRAAKLKKNYSRLSEANLDFRAQIVIVNLSANPLYPSTTPTIAEFTTIKNAYNEALQNCADGNKTAIAIKNQKKEALLTAMRNLSTNVESLAQGDRAKMVSTGFELASDGESVPPIPVPANFIVSNGLNNGELKLSVKRVIGAVSYLHEYTESPVTEQSVWISKISSSREHIFTGIRSGLRASARVAVIGTKGQEVYSDILTRVVQ